MMIVVRVVTTIVFALFLAVFEMALWFTVYWYFDRYTDRNANDVRYGYMLVSITFAARQVWDYWKSTKDKDWLHEAM